ncbi:hypothetical protein V5O48_019725, partial [Marasmius crinis-equi]
RKIYHAIVDSDEVEKTPPDRTRRDEASPEPEVAVRESGKPVKVAPSNIPLARKSSRSTTSSSI